MKKNSKRKVRDYSKYNIEQPEYYGYLYKNGRARIDVKRMEKTLRLDKHIVAEMNKQIKTVYFIPERIHRQDYMINIIRDIVEQLKRQWRDEIRPAMKNVKTPAQVKQEVASGFFMQSGILDYDECWMYGTWEGLKRESEYEYIMLTVIAQFIHQFVSVIESATLKVMVLKGYKSDSFSRREFDSFIQGLQEDRSKVNHQNKTLTLQDLKNYNKYDQMYEVWHFLKHNSRHLFLKIQKKYPEMLYEGADFKQGHLAMYVLKINTDYVNSLFQDTIDFFSELCSKVFDENVINAQWNYDSFFKSIVYEEIELYINPLGLPPIL